MTTETLPRKTLFARAAQWRPRGLPRLLVAVVLAAIFTHAMNLLMAQPRGYWLDPRLHSTESYSPQILASGPGLFALLVLAYLVIAALLLALLPPTPARVLAGGLFAFHLYPLIWRLYDHQALLAPHHIDEIGVAQGASMLVWPVLMLVGAWELVFPPIRARKWIARAAAGLLAAWVLLLSGLLAQTVRLVVAPPAEGWRVLVAEHTPSARGGASVAYDTERQRAVMFGGQVYDADGSIYFSAETWEWDGTDWTLVASGGPTGRSHAALGYDPGRKVVVLYGGQNHSGPLNDVWEWDGKAWNKRCPNCTPAKRTGGRFLYDESTRQLILYGGVGAKNTWYPESWVWNGNCWSYKTMETATPATFSPGIAYDSAQKRTLLYVYDQRGGTWSWQDSTFTHLHPPVEPRPLVAPAMVYDPQSQRAVLFGGIDNGAGGWYSDETWIFDQERWTRMHTQLAPSPRESMVSFYDPTRRSMIVFGGIFRQNLYNDLWELPLP